MSGRANSVDCKVCVIRHTGICAALTAEELDQLSRIAQVRVFKPGQVITRQADTPDFFASIVSGIVLLIETASDGRRQIVGLLFPPDFVGRPFGSRSSYAAVAASELSLCCFPYPTFSRFLNTHAGLHRRLLEHTLDELDAARRWMFLLGRKSAEERVASFLLLAARRATSFVCVNNDLSNYARFSLPMTRSDIADCLGLTNETVSREITRLRRREVIEIRDNRNVVVPDLAALRLVAGDDSAPDSLSGMVN